MMDDEDWGALITIVICIAGAVLGAFAIAGFINLVAAVLQ
jgi:hypothetical protein